VTSNTIGHVTIGLLIWSFLSVVSFNQPPFSHCFIWDIKFQRYWGHDLDLLGSRHSRDVICDWPLDPQYGVSYTWSIWSDRVYLAWLSTLLSFKRRDDIGLTTVTFWATISTRMRGRNAERAYECRLLQLNWTIIRYKTQLFSNTFNKQGDIIHRTLTFRQCDSG